MKRILIYLLLILCVPFMYGADRKHKRISADKIESMVVRYDPSVLRLPGNKVPIGLSTVLTDGTMVQTQGYLGGKGRWRDFKIEIEGGTYFNGNIFIDKNLPAFKGQELKVNVYHRKSGKLIRSQSIPMNYETQLYLVPVNAFRRSPGNKVDVSIITEYNNGSKTEFNPYTNRSLQKEYTYLTDGATMRFGNFYINQDPFTIREHTARLMTYLKKDPSIGDTLNIVLDYRDDFISSFYGSSGSDGFSGSSGFSGSTGEDGEHGDDGGYGGNGSDASDLEVFVDVYFDTLIHEQLMYVEINELHSSHLRRYLINTDGGSLSVYSHGGDGGDGGHGGSGGSGGDGANGQTVTETVQVNDSTTKEVTYQLPGQNGGNGGDGGYGGDGGDGGYGGNIYIDYTVYAEPYLDMIHAGSLGGDAGDGGFGGSGGSAGSGGSGDPSGSSGNSGRSGSRGRDGWSGSGGRVLWERIETNP